MPFFATSWDTVRTTGRAIIIQKGFQWKCRQYTCGFSCPIKLVAKATRLARYKTRREREREGNRSAIIDRSDFNLNILPGNWIGSKS